MTAKKIIPLELKLILKSYVQKHNINHSISNDKRNIFVVLAADYGNLGDVAISYAQYEYLKKFFPECNIVDVPISRNIKNIREVRRKIKEGDVITIVGGGNLTNKYQEIEDFRLAWIKSFPNSKIVSFPQTIDFSKDDKGTKSFNKSKSIYEAHKDFHIFARETISYNYMKKVLDTNIYLCPDIVLSQDQSTPSFERKGVLCCIREDSESIFSNADRTSLIKSIQDNFSSEVSFSDTHIGRGNLSWEERTVELEKIWSDFKHAKVVVTDRLHGMIFSVITNTPCVVLLNDNHKISQTYKDWLSENKSVCLVEKATDENVLDSINLMLKLETKQRFIMSQDHSVLFDVISK